MTVRVSLSSGEDFYIDAELGAAERALNNSGLVRVGGRLVNGSQVAQLVVAECPSIFTPEKLEQEVSDGVAG